MPTILEQLAPYRADIKGVVVESTDNWSWLVDGLMEADYRVQLANPAAMQQYSGLQYTDDHADARWLAHVLRLGVLPEGDIYPKAERAVRAVLRKRSHWVRQQTATVLSLHNIIVRHTGVRLSAKRIHALTLEEIECLLPEPAHVLAVTSSLAVVPCLGQQIKTLAKLVHTRLKRTPAYEQLHFLYIKPTRMEAKPMKAKLLITLVIFALASASVGAAAQTAGKVYRIGFLSLGDSSSPIATATREGVLRSLAQRGYSLGANLAIETRFAAMHPERLPALAKELVDSHVDVIATTSFPAARAAKDSTTRIPIVMDAAGDPVETGLAASLNRPGSNLTGISDMASELSAKRLELLKEAVPGLKRVALLWNADDPGMMTRYHAVAAAAPALGVALQLFGVRKPEDFDAAFAAMAREKPDGLMMVTDRLTTLNQKRVFEFTTTHRIPAIYEFDFVARAGGLMSYGAEFSEMTERTAALIDRILKGSHPADLPFERPTRFRFVVNRKTVEALGLTIPPTLLFQADEVIR